MDRDMKLFPSVPLRLSFGYAGEMKAMSVKKTEENIPKFMDPSVPLRFPFGSPSVMLVFSKKHCFQILFQVCPLFLGLTTLMRNTFP